MSGDDTGSSDEADADADPSRPDSSDGGPVDSDGEHRDTATEAGDPPAGERDGQSSRPDGRAVRDAGDRRPRRDGPSGPSHQRRPGGGSPRQRGIRWWVHRFRTARSGPLMIAREVLSSVALVAAIGLLLFAISGVWPPMVAVQSGSMEPHMHRGDLVFVVDENRFAEDAAVDGTGVTPREIAEGNGHEKFGLYGDVIIYEANGKSVDDPIIHRAMFWVEEGENWYDRANPEYVRADSCAELTHCPAPNSGFITKGDNNPSYDQAQRMSRPVTPGWITGKAMVRVPALGYIRLIFADLGRGIAVAFGAVVLGSHLQRRRLAP